MQLKPVLRYMHCELVLLLYPLTMNKEIGHRHSKPLEVYSQPSVSVISFSHFGHAYFIIQSYSEKINIQKRLTFRIMMVKLRSLHSAAIQFHQCLCIL